MNWVIQNEDFLNSHNYVTLEGFKLSGLLHANIHTDFLVFIIEVKNAEGLLSIFKNIFKVATYYTRILNSHHKRVVTKSDMLL